MGVFGHNASSPASSLLSTVETGVGTTAAFLISGWWLCNTHRQNKMLVIKSSPLSVEGYDNRGLWPYIIIKERVYVFFCVTRIAMLKVSQ